MLIPDYALVNNVNREINFKVHYKSDADLYNQPEFWTVAINKGDCEDFALAKRQALLNQGVDIECLRLATCWTENDAYHAVLIVTTKSGDYVLDNRYEFPMTKQDLPKYKWALIQKGDDWCTIVQS